MSINDDLAAAHKLLAGIRPKLDAFAQAVDNDRAGYPGHAAGFSSPGGGELTGPERIMEAVHSGRDPDPARTAQKRAKGLAHQIHQHTHELSAILANWLPGAMPPAPTTDHDMVGADGQPLWCRHCLTRGHRSPVDTRRPARALCRFCADWETGQGALPPTEVVEAHGRGERITTTFLERIKRNRKGR